MLEMILEDIAKSPTAYHAAATACEHLTEAGYERLSETGAWSLKEGGRYMVTRNNSSVIAFRMPRREPEGFRMVASHSDSPCFRVKSAAELSVKNHYIQLNTECYGGMIMSSWLDRPLSLAGRVVVRTAEGVETRLVDLAQDMVVIPNVPIHFNREINDGYKFNPQIDLLPLFSSGAEKGVYAAKLAKAAGVEPGDVLASDIWLYVTQKPFVWGPKQEYLSTPRYDDLGCAFTTLKSFLTAADCNAVPIWCMFDNEEVGSRTKQGADSDLLESVLRRIVASFGHGEEKYRRMLAGSMLVSADNAHAVSPNHPEKTDAENCVYMNEGIVIKYSANQQYTTDAVSAGIFAAVLDKAGIPHQSFANRSDIRGGSTLGNIAGSHVSVPSLDIGLAQLAMHSACETAGTADVDYMIRGIKAYYEADIRCPEDGKYRLG